MLADLIIQDISRVRRTIHRRIRTVGRLPSLTGSQVELLRAVEAKPGIGVGSAARTLNLAGNSVSALINQLVTIGYLRREVDDADRRAARLYLTQEATKRLRRWREARSNLVGEALSRLSSEDLDTLADVRPALQRLCEAVDQSGVMATPPRRLRRGFAPRSSGRA